MLIESLKRAEKIYGSEGQYARGPRARVTVPNARRIVRVVTVRAATIGRGVQHRVVKKGSIVAGKYTPLENYLRDVPANQKEITLSFEQIERIIHAKLPTSAYEYQAWWANEKEGNHVNARAWASAGWKVDTVHFGEKWVKFVRAATIGRGV